MHLEDRSMLPYISVLMPAYNAEKYILDAINSILSQTYQNFELLIADDGSTDGTKSIIDTITDPRVSRYHNIENLGKTTTVDILYKHSQGVLITIHDADDISLPTRFEKQVAEFLNHPDLGMCGTSFISVHEYCPCTNSSFY
jgi:glycosyltransferase involved in cell wall biosynthesis